MSGTPSNQAPPPTVTVTGLPVGTDPEYHGQHGSVVTYLQQADYAVEMAAAVNDEE